MRSPISISRTWNYWNSNAGTGKLCYVISDSAAAQLFDQPILGFDWEWGTVYQITVNVDQARAADGSLVKTCKLISVDSQSRVPEGTRFQMHLFDKTFIQGKTLLGVKPFQCATAGVEAELKRRLDNLAGKGAIPSISGDSTSVPAAKARDLPDETPRVLLEFSHPKTPSEPLILHGIALASDLGLECPLVCGFLRQETKRTIPTVQCGKVFNPFPIPGDSWNGYKT